MFSVPLSVLSLLRAGSKLFFFTLHPFYKGYCLFNALSFLSVFLDCFEHRRNSLSVIPSLISLFKFFTAFLSVAFPPDTFIIYHFRHFVNTFFNYFHILEQKNAPEISLRGDAHSTALSVSICGISTASSFGTSLCSISLIAASI